jgi:hypothetical protein
MSREEKLAVVRAFAQQYKKARKKGKGEILTQVSNLTGYSRKHLMEILIRVPGRRQIKRIRFSGYLKVLDTLKELWKLSNYATGQRLVPGIPTYLESLERHGELTVTEQQRQLLLQISSATADRLLKHERRKFQIKGRSGTKPGSLLKNQIPIHTWMDWDNSRPGFTEIDTVHHNGGNPSGEYIHTLDLTDVATAWNECRALMGRGEMGVVKALNNIRQRLPFRLLGIDFDSGGEFVNYHLIRYSKKNKISYSRARESVKNDQPYIEQQNYSVVRTYAGYKRFDTPRQLKMLNQLYDRLSDYQNFFQPVMRMKEKVRNGAHVTRRYSKAKTAYQRVLEHPDIPERVKEKLKQRYLTLNPKKLLEEILDLAGRL